MKKSVFTGILSVFLFFPIFSQIDTLMWDFEPGFNYYARTLNSENYKEFKIPNELKNYWGEPNSNILNDVPGLHGVTYFFVKNKLQVNKNLWLDSDLYVEQLGASFDLFNQGIVNIFPLVTLNYKKDILLFGDTIKSEIKYGVLKNHQEYNKLTVYGYDIQGLDFKSHYKDLKFSLTQISQLSFHNLEDPIHSRIYYSKKLKETNFEIGIGGHAEPYTNTVDEHMYKGLDIGLSVFRDSSNFEIYAQYSSNSFEEFNLTDNLKNTYSAVLGIKGTIKFKKLTINHFLEARIYTYLFNAARLGSSNAIHPQYYFQRDMLTWSRFIELHSATVPGNITGINYNFNSQLNISNGSSFYLKSELALLSGENITNILYPFYNIGYQYKIKNNTLEAGLSNKIFVDYLYSPNFALMKTPFINLTIIHKANSW